MISSKNPQPKNQQNVPQESWKAILFAVTTAVMKQNFAWIMANNSNNNNNNNKTKTTAIWVQKLETKKLY